MRDCGGGMGNGMHSVIRHPEKPAGSPTIDTGGLTYNPLRGDANPGKKSSKNNQDCTICRSCREAMIASVVLE